jgi:peptidyl-prolyl cis-trans isomerase D
MESKPKKPVHHIPLTHAEKEKKTNRWVTIGFAITAVLIVLVIGYGILNETVFKNNTAVATIGNEKITGKEFIERVLLRRKLYVENYRSVYNMAQYFASDQNMYSYFTSQLQSYQAALADPKLFGQSVLDQMVEERIIAMEAVKKGIKVSEQEVDNFLQGQFGFFPNGTPTATPTPVIFGTPTFSPTQVALLHYTPAPTLAPEATAIAEPTFTPAPPTITPTISANLPTATPEPTATVYTQDLYNSNLKEYYATLESVKVPEQALRDYVRFYLIRLKLQDAYNLSPEKSEQVWARHILVKTEADAKIVLDRLVTGEDWAKIAAEVSIDTGTKDNGGDLGWFTRSKMVKTFEDAAFALKVGEVSAPVQSDFGWHIIQAIGHDSIPMVFEDWIAQVKLGLKVELKNWENIVPIEPTIPPELILPAEYTTLPTESIIPTKQP